MIYRVGTTYFSNECCLLFESVREKGSVVVCLSDFLCCWQVFRDICDKHRINVECRFLGKRERWLRGVVEMGDYVFFCGFYLSACGIWDYWTKTQIWLWIGRKSIYVLSGSPPSFFSFGGRWFGGSQIQFIFLSANRRRPGCDFLLGCNGQGAIKNQWSEEEDE